MDKIDEAETLDRKYNQMRVSIIYISLLYRECHDQEYQRILAELELSSQNVDEVKDKVNYLLSLNAVDRKRELDALHNTLYWFVSFSIHDIEKMQNMPTLDEYLKKQTKWNGSL
jgi:hypothetical protein